MGRSRVRTHCSRRRLRRLLRYVVRANDGVSFNLRLVAIGPGTPRFYEGRRGMYANRLEMLTEREARRESVIDDREDDQRSERRSCNSSAIT